MRYYVDESESDREALVMGELIRNDDMPAGNEGRTLVEVTYQRLRREILEGTLAPDSKLGTEELRARYNVAGSTIREALTRLLGEALVTSEGQRGFRVAPASLEDFRDLTEVRMLIETEALRQSIANGDEAWESQVVAAFYRLSKVEKRLVVDPAGAAGEFEERNREFHQALIAACPSRWLHHINGLLYQQSERYRRIAVSRRNVPRDVHAEHQAILDATLARDVDLACKLTAEHIERTLTVLRSVMAKQAQPTMSASDEARPKATTKGTKKKRIGRTAG